jgi:hypothetical protein
MRRSLLLLSLLLVVSLFFSGQTLALEKTSSSTVVGQESLEGELDEATESGELEAVLKVEEKPKEKLTEPEETKSRLEEVLDSQEIDSPWPFNFFKVAIRRAVNEGVPPNIFVLILLFPLTAALVAFSRNVMGVKGFGIFIPAAVSVAFLSTGVVVGVILFLSILLAASLARRIIRKVRMQYFPRMAMLIWAVSLAVFGLLLMSPFMGSWSSLQQTGIFPVLLFILLADPFIEAQIHKSTKTALVMAVETMVLALIAYWVMSSVWLQETVLLQPELAILSVMLVNYVISRYRGLRLLEIWRFRDILK